MMERFSVGLMLTVFLFFSPTPAAIGCHIIALAVGKGIFTSFIYCDLFAQSVSYHLRATTLPVCCRNPCCSLEYLEYNMYNWPGSSQHRHYAPSLPPMAINCCYATVALNPFDGKGSASRRWTSCLSNVSSSTCKLWNIIPPHTYLDCSITAA